MIFIITVIKLWGGGGGGGGVVGNKFGEKMAYIG